MSLLKKIHLEIIASLLVIVTALAFGLIKFSNNVPQVQTVRTISISKNEVDYQSFFETFYDAELQIEDNSIWFSGYKDIDASILSYIDNVSLEEIEQAKSSVKYEFYYDVVENVMILEASLKEGSTTVIERIAGIPFIDETGEVDIAFNMEGSVIYLSELSDTSVLNECGWFSKLIKVVAAVAVAAVVVAAVAAVVVVAAPAVITAGVAVINGVAAAVATTATVTVGGGVVAGATATALISTAATTAAITATTAFAGSVAAVAATTALVAGATALTLTAAESAFYQTVEFASPNTKIKTLAKTIIATIAELTLERKYHFAYIDGMNLNINRSISFNYLEAYALLLASGLINSITDTGGLAGKIANLALPAELKQLADEIRNNSRIKIGYFGFYTLYEDDAAKLAYAAGGFFKGAEQSEIHNATSGSGYYYHFHDFLHIVHVWYDLPA